ncbi:MAG: molybdopterin-dependent oxidoreductase [Desulfobacterales bacterium]|nr:molybdopterin-dependent oxidoreductase [Desulfobacterales bacterium]
MTPTTITRRASTASPETARGRRPTRRCCRSCATRLDLTGAKEGCNEGECGACVVLVDGKAVNACLMLAVEADGREVTTIEGLGQRRRAAPAAGGVPQARRRAVRLLHAGDDHRRASACSARTPTRARTTCARALSGNLCRCTGYRQIIDAVQEAAADAARRRPGRSRADDREPTRWVGTDVPRVDGLEKVTGAARYTADLKFARMLHAVVVRSPHAHARVLDVRLDKAARVPGRARRRLGRGVPVPHRHLPQGPDGLRHRPRALRRRPGRRRGGRDPRGGAPRPRRCVEVEYEPLPADLRRRRGARSRGRAAGPPRPRAATSASRGSRPQAGTNVCNHLKVRKGDYEAALPALRARLRAHLPGPAGAARARSSRHVSVAARRPARARSRSAPRRRARSPCATCCAPASTLPHGDVRVMRAARRRRLRRQGRDQPRADRGRPRDAGAAGAGCALLVDRAEEFYADGRAPGARARPSSPASTGSGKVQAQKLHYLWNCGAYGGYGVNVVRAAGYTCGGAYEFPNVWGDSIGVYTNRPVGQRLPRLRHAARSTGRSSSRWTMVARELGHRPGRVPPAQLPRPRQVHRHRAGARRALRARRPAASRRSPR